VGYTVMPMFIAALTAPGLLKAKRQV